MIWGVAWLGPIVASVYELSGLVFAGCWCFVYRCVLLVVGGVLATFGVGCPVGVAVCGVLGGWFGDCGYLWVGFGCLGLPKGCYGIGSLWRWGSVCALFWVVWVVWGLCIDLVLVVGWFLVFGV